MNYFNEGGITAPLMGVLAGVNQSTISRYINQAGILPIPNSLRKTNKYSIHDARIVLGEYVGNRHPIDPKKSIQCFYNFKGGTGKTTLCYQYATHLSFCGYKVLLIDADPQAHLTSSLSPDIMGDSFYTLYDLLIDNIPYKEVIKPVSEGLDCIPSDISLSRIEIELNNMGKREEKLAQLLKKVQREEEYDLIIMDTNPTISLLNRNVVFASHIINIITETAPYSLNGLKILMEDLQKFYKTMDSQMPYLRIIANKYEDRSAASAEGISLLHQFYANNLIREFAVRKSEDFVTASKIRAPLGLFCKTNSNAYKDICDLIHICLEQIQVDKNENLFSYKGVQHG